MHRGLLYEDKDDKNEPARRWRRLATDQAIEGSVDDDNKDQGFMNQWRTKKIPTVFPSVSTLYKSDIVPSVSIGKVL